MEPVANLKRPCEFNNLLCIICQETGKKDTIMNCTEQGLIVLKESANTRTKLNDIKYRDTNDRIDSLINLENLSLNYVYHKACYSTFTSKKMIDRLRKQREAEVLSCAASTSRADVTTPVRLRSQTTEMNWKLCLVCQKEDPKQRLSDVTTLNRNAQILQAAKYDEEIRIRVANINDLIAAEACYHNNCMKRFIRESEKAKDDTKNVDLAMIWLGRELHKSAEKGHVLEMAEVWMRYTILCKTADIEVPQSFLTRQATFKAKLSVYVNNIYEFIVLKDQKQTILIPTKFSHVPISQWRNEIDPDTADSEECISTSIPRYRADDDDEFRSMVHVALKMRYDILNQEKHKGLDISEESAINCVPKSVYMFLRLLLGGQSALEVDDDDDDGPDYDRREEDDKSLVLSMGQDFVYNVSRGQHKTPKHIGLASILHQSTRSKQLVHLFHKAGHTVSYHDVLKIDSGLAEETLKSMDKETGTVIPPNLSPDRFVHFSADNVDINDGTLNGKDTFHATQMAAWQRGPEKADNLQDIEPSKNETLIVPPVMDATIPIHFTEGVSHAKFDHIDKAWFDGSNNIPTTTAEAKDISFNMLREHETNLKQSWTSFNKEHDNTDEEVTTIGFMPIIQAPAHEIETLNTVVKRAIEVAKSVNQKHVVLTVDQALFPALMDLKWSVPEYKDVLYPLLGGLHISMNFLKVLGQHTADCGLSDLWVESAMYGCISTERAMSGKSYSKGVRGHKLTLQALWKILLPHFRNYLQVHDPLLADDISTSLDSGYEALLTTLSSNNITEHIDKFVEAENDPNMKFWWDYMKMVTILLLFIRGQREGNWQIYLDAFRNMLPFFFRYNHTNYARWGTVYLALMNNLPEELKREFENGNFVVKGSSGKFNQVSPDHSQEWMNAVGKKSGGIVGITKTTTALNRWALSYNLRTVIASKTRRLFNIDDRKDMTNEEQKARKGHDNDAETSLFTTFNRHNIFNHTEKIDLQNIATKDMATPEIQESLLDAKTTGQDLVNKFVEERLLPNTNDETTETATTENKLRQPLRKEKILTFSTLYTTKIKVKGKEATVKADRNILQRIIVAYKSGRKIDLDNILKHELMNVPISIAESNSTLRFGNKAVLTDLLTESITSPAEITVPQSSCIVIDGQALIVALGRPHGINTFGEYADIFTDTVYNTGKSYSRIDVAFDQYRDTSIKDGTRKKRAKMTRGIRRIVDDPSTPLPVNWSNFMSVSENKADLARMVSERLIINAPSNKTVVVSGGFAKEDEVKTSNPNVDVSGLKALHEEADTRLVLHAIHANCDTVVVCARDTDVLILLVAHRKDIPAKEIWMRSGTSKKRKYIPLHSIFLEDSMRHSLPALHAISGCDSVSQFCGHAKKSAWNVFTSHHNLLANLGQGDLTEQIIQEAESFVCRLYNVDEINSCDKARVDLFDKGKAQEDLPPTTDAVRFHIKRAHYQSLVWNKANVGYPILPSPAGMGWEIVDGKLVPTLMSLPPIPESCKDIVSCGCSKGCSSRNCSCRKNNLPCTGACKCNTATCTNKQTN